MSEVRKFARRLALGACSFLAVAACGAASAQDAAPQGDSGTAITTIVLRNGVTCAVMDGVDTKALQCDWSGPRLAPTGTDPKGDRGTTITVVSVAGRECAVMDGKPGKALSCDGMH